MADTILQPAPQQSAPGKSPDTRVFHDIPVTPLHDWTRDGTKAAIRQHDLGFFYLSSQLAEAMLADDRVASVLETRILGLLGCDRKVTTPEGLEDDEEAKAVATELDARWNEMLPDDVLKALLRWVVLLRFALAEILWSGDENGWSFKLKLWHPQFVWYDVSRRQYVVNTQEGPVWITPGDGKWLLWAPDGFYRGWILGAIRSLADPWLARTDTFCDFAKYCEVHGLPIKKIKVPSEAPEPEKDKFFSQASNLGSNNTLMCPQGVGKDSQGWDFELVEAEAGEWEAFQALTKICDTRISIRLLGQNLTTEAGSGAGGTLGAGEVHNLVRIDYKRADNKSLFGALCEQVFKPWVMFNHGRPEIAPDASFQVEPPDDRKANADTLGIVATATAALATVPDVDKRALLEKFDVPLFDPDKVPALTVRPDESFAPSDGGASTQPDTNTTSRQTLARVLTPPGSKRGQDYVEDVASMARDRAAEAMKPNVAKVLAAISKASSYDEMRPLLAQAFQELDPTELAHVTESALVLSQLAGRHALITDAHAPIEP